ncbi:MAG: phosphotransferase [Hydrogenophaga sp.]|nr:phosphotransferase [Hydrogenophaga sp.]
MKAIEAIVPRLRLALQAVDHPAAALPLEHLRDKGLAHDHVRLVGSGLLARIPKQSQMGLAASDNLTYQRACFERAVVSGHTPALQSWLQPSTHLPRGALLVQEIEGRPAQLPADLGAMATALAALHALPVPRERAPLLSPPDPLRHLCDELATQMKLLPAASLGPSVARVIECEWRSVQTLLASSARPPQCLIAFDAHPGNFIVQADGQAMLVDLEKCRYAYPGLDLAHATLYTSTTWDVETRAELTPEQVGHFYAAWTGAVGSASEGAAAWHLPLRRAMWLWSLTWCAKWRATSGAAASSRTDGEDWSSEHSEAALVAHVRDRVDHYLSLPVVSRVHEEFAALKQLLPT